MAKTQVNAVIAKYLQSNGYDQVLEVFQKELLKKKEEDISSIETFANAIGLEANACTTNHILFYGLGNGNASAYLDGYIKVFDWIINALDMYKDELYTIIFPLFVNIYLDLIHKNLNEDAQVFFTKHSSQHQRLHANEIRQLALVLTQSHLKTNTYARNVLLTKFHIQMSLMSFELLNAFLSDTQLFIFLCLINQRITISILENHPELQMSSSTLRPTSSADELSKRASVDVTHASIGTQLVESTGEMARMVHASGQAGIHVQNLNQSKVLWGVLSTTTGSSDVVPPVNTENKPEDEDGMMDVVPLDVTVPITLKKQQLHEEKGPYPDRQDAYNRNIMENILLRKSPYERTKMLHDVRNRASLDKNLLPSALCFTVTNASHDVNSITFTDDATMVSVGCGDSSLRVWRNDNLPLGSIAGRTDATINNVPDEQRRTVLRGHSGPVYASDFSPDHRFLLSSSADQTVRLWSLASRSNVVVYPAHHYSIWDVTFSPVGYYYATASCDTTARLFSTDRTVPLRMFVGHLSDVLVVKFHPNSNYIATGSSDRTIRLWDVQSGHCIRLFSGHYGSITTLAFSPNGRLLAAAGEDLYITIWDLSTGKRLDTLVGHTSRICDIAFSQEGSLLASGGKDTTVKLWDTSSFGQTPCSLPAFTPSRVRLSSDIITPSSSLLSTFYTKDTPVQAVQFTASNLLLVGGTYARTTDAVK